MIFQTYSSKFPKWGKNSRSPNRPEFSQPSHHLSSDVEPDGARGHSSLRPAPSVGTQSLKQKQSLGSIGSANTNPNDAANNPIVGGRPQDRDDHLLNSGEKEKK